MGVFERSAVISFISQSEGDAVSCPIPGCPHLITKSSFSNDDETKRLIAEKEENKMNHEDVLDLSSDDNDDEGMDSVQQSPSSTELLTEQSDSDSDIEILPNYT